VDVTATLAGTGTRFAQGNELPLGMVVIGSDGDEWLYCHAQEALAANDAVLVHETFEAEKVDTTSTASAFGQRVGVTEVAVSDNDFFWLKISGETTLNVGTSAAANAQLNSTGTAGRLDDDATVGAEIIEGIVTTGTESGNAANAILDRPRVGATIA